MWHLLGLGPSLRMRALSVFVSGRPWQLFGLFLCQKRGATTLQLLAVSVDQGRSRSVAPARSILRPLTRYKGRSANVDLGLHNFNELPRLIIIVSDEGQEPESTGPVGSPYPS